MSPKPLSAEFAHSYISKLSTRFSGKNYLASAVAFGSLSRGEFRPTSDFDVRLISKQGTTANLKTFFMCMYERLRANLSGFPLDIYIFEMEDFEHKVSKTEPAIIMSDSDHLFDNYSAGTVSIEDALKVLEEAR